MKSMSKTATTTDGPRSIGSRPNARSSTHWRQRRHKPLRRPRSPQPQPTNPRGPRRNRPRRVRMPRGFRELRRNGPQARRKRRQPPSQSRAVRRRPERARAERRRPEENGVQNTISRRLAVATDKRALRLGSPAFLAAEAVALLMTARGGRPRRSGRSPASLSSPNGARSSTMSDSNGQHWFRQYQADG